MIKISKLGINPKVDEKQKPEREIVKVSVNHAGFTMDLFGEDIGFSLILLLILSIKDDSRMVLFAYIHTKEKEE